MVIYWDLILGSTLLVNYSLLKTIMIAFKQKVSRPRMLIAQIVGLISLTLFFMPPIVLPLRYFLGIIIGLIAFPKENVFNKTAQIACFYLLNFAFIGTLIIFQVSNIFFLIIAMFYIIILFLLDNVREKVLKSESLTYDVNILGVDEKIIGYMDTGNTSLYKQCPIVFLDESFKNEFFKYIKQIELMTLGGNVKVDLFEGSKLFINQQEFDVYYVFVSLLEHDLILNYHMEVKHD